MCGYDKCLEALVFHHRNPKTKEFGLSKYPFGWDRLRGELDKCDLLCARCHIEVHTGWQEAKRLEQEAIVREHRKKPSFQITCEQCFKIKKIPSSRYKRSDHHFCSRACSRDFTRATRSNLPKETTPRRHTPYPDDALLRELVWQVPMTKIAQSLGITDVALKKACRRRAIPTPPRGHWTGLKRKATS